ncbi:MAG TPA: hypothetical protein VF595_05010 [Tepidisphaeraceae bacterium]|jgi:hypothetical protein
MIDPANCPDVECLERRTLLAGVGEPTLTSRGTLIISGTDADDRIVVTVKHNKTRVIIRDTAGGVLLDRRYRRAEFKRVAVDAGAGHDLVMVSPAFTRSVVAHGGDGNDVLFEGSGIAVLDGGAGNDVLGRPGDDAFANPVTLAGGGGNDLLQPDLTDFADGGVGIDAIGRDTSARTIQTNGIESSSRFVTGVDADGVLRVTGTNAGEEISIFANGPTAEGAGRLTPVYADVTTYSPSMSWKPLIKVDLTDFSSVVLDGIGGDDDLVVAYEIDKPMTLNGGSGNDRLRAFRDAVLNGGPGNDMLSSDGGFSIWHKDGKPVARGGDVSVFGIVEHFGGDGNDTILADLNDVFDGGPGVDTASLPYTVVRPNNDPPTAGQYEQIRDATLPTATATARRVFGRLVTHYNVERVTATITVTNLRAYDAQEDLVPL